MQGVIATYAYSALTSVVNYKLPY